ncbi:MAG TPA: LysR family transcriptional regulator [Gemmatimonadaceae bacterium]|nr:LysR family transcriptional regulator [Gemmatimonadaceae bacterium]
MESTLEIRQLRAFVALVEQGRVTAAAQSLGLAQSTVSEALTSLERAVGAAVFLRRRGSHELTLTEAGEALLPHARAMLEQIDAAHVAVAGATMRARATVAIATNESLSTYVLSAPLEVMRRTWPNTIFGVSIMMCAGVRSGVEAGEYDLGFMLQPCDEDAAPTIAERTVVTDDVSLVLFTQPSHPLRADRAPVKRDALVGFTLYLTDSAGDFHAAVRRFLTGDGLPGPQLQPTGSVESVKRGVLGDPRAIGMLPAYALVDEMRAGRVVPLRVHPGPPRMRLEALASTARAQHPAVRQLLDSVLATYTPIQEGVAIIGGWRAEGGAR